MLLTLALIVFGYSLNFLSCQVKADTCDTYNHPQYGIGQCVDQNECPNGLFLSGLCESQPTNIKCCFSLEPMKEEFRGIWIATVANIDWPSSRTATPAQQRSELITILNKVQELNMNAVIFQVLTHDVFPPLNIYSANIFPFRYVQLVMLCMLQHWNHGVII